MRKPENPNTHRSRYYEQHKPLGTDQRGRIHHFDEHNRTIHVIDSSGARQHIQELGERPIADWVAYVDEKTGWANRTIVTVADVFGGP